MFVSRVWYIFLECFKWMMAKLDTRCIKRLRFSYSISSHPLTHCFIHSTTTKTILQEGRPEQRNASDAAALAAKVAKKAEMKQKQEEAATAEASHQTVVRKKTNKKKEDDNLDDLLSAGLGKGKKK